MKRTRLKAYILAIIGTLWLAPACAQGGMGPGPGTVHSTGGGGAMSIVTDSTAQQYLTRTWSNSPTDPTRVTISYWINNISTFPSFVAGMYSSLANAGVLFNHFYNVSTFHHQVRDDAGSTYDISEFVYSPDTGVWHQVVVSIDTNLATAGDRIKIYVDGVNIAATGTNPSLGENVQATPNGIASFIGAVSYFQPSSTGIPDAKFAYFYLIDGQALTPSSFTTGTGVGSIHPATYGGTYGNNGFFLNGSGSTLSDQSGNANNWTAPNGISYSTDLPI